jgi:hypothetical protein
VNSCLPYQAAELRNPLRILCLVYHSIALNRVARNMKSHRRSPRSSFVVTGEITDESSRTVISRIRGLNLFCCYIEMANPLPQGTSIFVKISAGKAGPSEAESPIRNPIRVRASSSKALSRIINPFLKSGCWKPQAWTRSTKEQIEPFTLAALSSSAPAWKNVYSFSDSFFSCLPSILPADVATNSM